MEGSGKSSLQYREFRILLWVALYDTMTYHNCSKGSNMTTTTSIHIDQSLYDQAKTDAAAEHRTISGQVEYWAKVGRAALDNPDLPVSFIAESLASMAESREQTTPFVPRSRTV